MSLIALGINHRTAPIELREQVAITGERVKTALRDLAALPSVSEAAILSTCNRTELYCGLEDDHIEVLSEWLAQFHALDPAQIRPHLYSFPDADAVRHLLRVAGGLDSMILGEPQILGQMKEAYQAAGAGHVEPRFVVAVPAVHHRRQAEDHEPAQGKSDETCNRTENPRREIGRCRALAGVDQERVGIARAEIDRTPDRSRGRTDHHGVTHQHGP